MEALIDDLTQIQQSHSAPPSYAASGGHFPVMAKFQQDVVQLLHLSSSHSDGQKLSQAFVSSWTGKSKPHVRDIFVVLQNSPEAITHLQHHKAYEKKVKDHMHATARSQYLTYTFHGTVRGCKVGADPSQTSPCHQSNCKLCSILRSSFQMKYIGAANNFGRGFYSSVDSYKASTYLGNVDSADKTYGIIVCTVVTGRKEVLRVKAPTRTAPSSGYDSIEGDKSVTGHSETIVFTEDAILPHALIMYTNTTASPSTRTAPTPVNLGIYTFVNELFAKALDLNVNDGRVVGFRLHGHDNQLWVLEQEGGGWVISNKKRPERYLGLKYENSFNNGMEAAGVDYDHRLIWELQPAMNGTIRLGLHKQQINMMSGRLPSKNLDLNKHSGNVDGAQVTLWDHVQNADQQRWAIDYVAKSPVLPKGNIVSHGHGRVQTPVNHGIYTFKNEQFGKALDMQLTTDKAIGFQPHGGDNQKWIFEQEGGGWIIRNKLHPGKYLALYYDNSYNNGQEAACVDYTRRLIWEVQPAADNTVRLALHAQQRHMTSSRLPGKNLDLDKRAGSTDRTHITLWDHLQNAGQQRWIMEYVGNSSASAQTTANVPTGIVHIVNNRFKSVLDWNRGNDEVIGYALHGGKNQQWTFEPVGSGYAIKNTAAGTPRYLGLSPDNSSNGSKLVVVDQAHRVIWTVQSAKGNTFRVARLDHPSACLDMSIHGGPSNGTPVVLFSHTSNATHQRWELISPGTKPTPSAVASNTPTQTVVQAGVYTITNARFKNGMDLSLGDMQVIGYSKHGGLNQQWIFEQSGSGWIIRNGSDINNFLSTDHNSRSNGTAIVCSTNKTRWVVQAAEGNTVRIALESSQSTNLDMSTWGRVLKRYPR